MTLAPAQRSRTAILAGAKTVIAEVGSFESKEHIEQFKKQVSESLDELQCCEISRYVDGKIIEVHLRWNDDFSNHNSNVIYPVWKEYTQPQPKNTTWYPSPGGDRLGFWISK